ncbi:MAG TPA: glycogen/starch synthase [Haloplasmataceae bacterium]
MKIYEYARARNIKSRDVVKKLHGMGFTFIKNHLSLVPEKVIDKLDEIPFENRRQVKRIKTIVNITMECAPIMSLTIGEKIKNKLLTNRSKKHNIIIMPKYQMDESALEKVMDLEISIRDTIKTGKVYYTSYMDMDYFLVDNEYFLRPNAYNYPDDAERFAFLSKAALGIIKSLNVNIDIINIHDWPLGLFPILFKESIKEDFPNTLIEFSVYSATYQGIYDIDVLTNVFELDEKYYYENRLVEYANSVNFLKAGLVTSDKIDVSQNVLFDLKNSYLKAFVYDNKLNKRPLND